jgi:hypothetical protein
MDTITKQQLLDQLALLTKLVTEDKVVDKVIDTPKTPKKRGRKKKVALSFEEETGAMEKAIWPESKVVTDLQKQSQVHTIKKPGVKIEADKKYGRKEKLDTSIRYNQFYDTGEFANESVKKNPNNLTLGVPRSNRPPKEPVQYKMVTKTCFVCKQPFEISSTIPTTELTRCNNCLRVR